MSGVVELLHDLWNFEPEWPCRAEQLAQARDSVAELIEAAEEVKADAAILGMDIPRLETALRRVKGEG